MRVALALIDPRDLEVARQVVIAAEHDEVGVADEIDLLVVDGDLMDRPDVRMHALSDLTALVTVGAIATVPGTIANLERPLDAEPLRRILEELDQPSGDRTRKAIELVSATSLFAGPSQRIHQLRHEISLIAQSDEPVSIFGDDGAGRWVVAQAIHECGPRRQRPFVAINASAHPPERLEELLFGADGTMESAASGTLFIDRLAMAGPSTQRMLVHALQEPTTPHVRMIAGMRTGVAVGFGFPSVIPDLYYRLKVCELEIPRLRERSRDLDSIVGAMLSSLGAGSEIQVAPEAMRMLQRYSFPGNLVELAHTLIHAFVISNGTMIRAEHLPPSIQRELNEHVSSVDTLGSLDEVVKRFERDYLLQVLRAVGGHRGRASTLLGLSRKGLWGKLKAHAITNEEIHLAVELPGEGPKR
jgi:DNA-binding NtrC family response regulator